MSSGTSYKICAEVDCEDIYNRHLDEDKDEVSLSMETPLVGSESLPCLRVVAFPRYLTCGLVRMFDMRVSFK